MIDPGHLLNYVIRPVLKNLDLWSEAAERLVLGTACQESECGRWLHQLGGGPALGIFQMEPATWDDIATNFLVYRKELDAKVEKWACVQGPLDAEEMIGNLYYATAMCRVHYLRVPEPIPDYLGGQAAYWKKYYNTELGRGTVQEYLNSWNRFIKPDALV